MNKISVLDNSDLFGNDIRKVLITPEMAKKYLAQSKGNRSLRRAKVDSYKEDMLNGNWVYNGDVIRFLENGALFDGHHRLTAIAESGVSAYANILIINESAAKTIDKGATRTLSDDFHFEYGYGPHDAMTVTTAIKHIILHDKGIEHWGKGASGGGVLGKWLTSSSVLDWHNKNSSRIKPSLQWVNEKITKNRVFVPKGAICALHFLSNRSYGEDATYFLDKVFTGHEIIPDSIADNLRNWLIACAMQQIQANKEKRILTVAKCIKADMAGKSIKFASIPFSRSHQKIPFFTGK